MTETPIVAVGCEIELVWKAADRGDGVVGRPKGSDAILFPRREDWPTPPEPGVRWVVRVVEHVKGNIYRVAPVRNLKLDPHQPPADGLQLGKVLTVVWEKQEVSHGKGVIAKVDDRHKIFPSIPLWQGLPRPGSRWKVKVVEYPHPGKSIYLVAPVNEIVPLNVAESGTRFEVLWRDSPGGGVEWLDQQTGFTVFPEYSDRSLMDSVPLPGSKWRVEILRTFGQRKAILVKLVERREGPKARKTESVGNDHYVVTFSRNEYNHPTAYINGIRALPDQNWAGPLPKYGESWEVRVRRRTATCWYLYSVKKM